MTELDLPVLLDDGDNPNAALPNFAVDIPAGTPVVDPYDKLVAEARHLLADLLAAGVVTPYNADAYAARLGLAPLEKFTVNVTVSATVVATVSATDADAAVVLARRQVGNGLPYSLSIAGFPVRHPLVDEAVLAG